MKVVYNEVEPQLLIIDNRVIKSNLLRLLRYGHVCYNIPDKDKHGISYN